MCVWHCYIKEKDVEYLKKLNQDIEYEQECSIMDVIYKLTTIEAIEYILDIYLDKFNYYNVNLYSIINNLNLSNDDKNYLKYKFKNKIDVDVDMLDYEDSDFDIDSLELYIQSQNIDISTDFMFDVISNIPDNHLEDVVDWFIRNSDIKAQFIMDAVITRGNLNIIRCTWEQLKDSL